MNAKEIIEFIDGRLKGSVVPFDVERDAIQLIEEYAEAKNKKLIEALKEIERTVTQGAYSSETITRIISKVIEI